MRDVRPGLVLAWAALVLLLAACGQDPEPARPVAASEGYRVESGERFAFTMEVPASWESLRGGTLEGARVKLAGSEFVADFSVTREATAERSIEGIRRGLDAYLASSGTRAVRDSAVTASGLAGWSWEFAAQPAQGPRPRREAQQLVILYDPRGYQWLLTYNWASPDVYQRYREAFEHALQTFRAK